MASRDDTPEAKRDHEMLRMATQLLLAEAFDALL
ncbi:hypothetical protein AWB73_01998 [Caballeronia turbans]|nr:hypothetical protein AWB73_01998 [Caballeronia turbans]